MQVLRRLDSFMLFENVRMGAAAMAAALNVMRFAHLRSAYRAIAS